MVQSNGSNISHETVDMTNGTMLSTSSNVTQVSVDGIDSVNITMNSIDGEITAADQSPVMISWTNGEKIFQVLIRTCGLLSFVCFTYLVCQSVIQLRQTPRRNPVVTRLVLYVSSCGAFLSLMYMLGTTPIPISDEDQQQWGAMGTAATCSFQAFIFIGGGIAFTCWDMLLSVTYVLMVRYHWSNHSLLKLQSVMHGMIWTFAIILPTLAQLDESFNSSHDYCFLLPSPEVCAYVDTIPCERGENYFAYFIVVYVILWLGLIVSIVSMIIIYCTVRGMETRNHSRYSSHLGFQVMKKPVSNSSTTSTSNNSGNLVEGGRALSGSSYQFTAVAEPQHERSRQVGIQGLFYVGTAILTYGPITIATLLSLKAGLWVFEIGQICIMLNVLHGVFYLYAFLRNRKNQHSSSS